VGQIAPPTGGHTLAGIIVRVDAEATDMRDAICVPIETVPEMLTGAPGESGPM
jgi:hypothetical protein